MNRGTEKREQEQNKKRIGSIIGSLLKRCIKKTEGWVYKKESKGVINEDSKKMKNNRIKGKQKRTGTTKRTD